MRVFSGIGRLVKARPPLKDVVIAIGVFDGIHPGHRDVIARAVADARRIHGTCLVMTFHPHPVLVLHPERFSAYITTLPQRIEMISALGVDACLVVPFTKRFAKLAPADFIKRYLVRTLRIRKVVVGDDFHFGHDRAGTIRVLRAQGRSIGFSVEISPIKKIRNINIKSSIIRKKLLAGDLDGVSVLLGRPYVLRGRVVHGDARGRRLGYPTANVKKENVIIPPSGIYVARVFVGKKKYDALLYIGRRPSFKGGRSRTVIEAYLLDYQGSLYGRTIDVEILKWIRNERKFSDEKSLIGQIKKDERYAREYFVRLNKKRR